MQTFADGGTCLYIPAKFHGRVIVYAAEFLDSEEQAKGFKGIISFRCSQLHRFHGEESE